MKMLMKKRNYLFLSALVFAFVLVCGGKITYASQAPEETPAVYNVTIAFDKNGGSGSMAGITVPSNVPTALPANTFTKKGYEFNGWNTQADGKGTGYADKADVTGLATEENNGSTVTLYAQWQLTAPKIKTTKSNTPYCIKITYAKGTSVSGYEIQYSTSKSFAKKKTTTLKALKNSTSAELSRVVPNKKYYVRMRSYKKAGSGMDYSAWSKTTSVKVKNGKTIMNVKCDTAVEADIKLNGSGTGYHAKIVMGNQTSAVSFGLQFDDYAEAPYTHKTMALIENIASNAAGGQNYSRVGNPLKKNKTYHLMMASDGKDRIDLYLDYKKIGSVRSDVAATSTFVRIEGCARLTGDKVDAQFSHIRYKIARNSPVRVLGDDLKWTQRKLNKGLAYKYDKSTGIIRIYGTEVGVNGDWDSDYEGVSEILQFEY